MNYELVNDLALILVVAGITTLIFKWLRQPLVLGYIVAGFLVSPQMPYTMSVVNRGNVQSWADIGVIFLLFSLGLDFSFKKILKMGGGPVISAFIIIFCMMMTGYFVGHAFSWAEMDCIFLGGMLAMSSTTIIYKAFDDMGLRQQQFAGMVMSVLILEDILAIVMMVMLSAVARGNAPDGGQLLYSVLSIAFFLILWFVVGIFAIPAFLRRTRRMMTDETMLIVAIGLCCLMAVVSTHVGFSSAFGAFVMGSILAETVEADKIIRLVEPVKNLFGAVFFVSVGMLVEPRVLAEHAAPIIVLVLTILIGQSVFGSLGYLLGGQPLKSAMRCGFSMAQIGEFAFIIASLGLSLGVISDFLYPVVVAVSVITTFLTPYMIRSATPAYQFLEHRLPRRVTTTLNSITLSGSSHTHTAGTRALWRSLLSQMAVTTAVYSIISISVMLLMLTFFLPFIRHILTGWHWTANFICGALTVLLMSPFLRAIVMKKSHSRELQALWHEHILNRAPIILLITAKVAIACSFIFYLCNYLSRFTDTVMISIAIVMVVMMVFSRSIKNGSIRLERLFIKNLRSREVEALVHGRKRPLYENRLLDRDVHLADFDVPMDSVWTGMSLARLQLRQRFGVHVSSILRANHRLNIPDGNSYVYPGDRLQVIGSDEQLTKFGTALRKEVQGEDLDFEKREMKLRQIALQTGSPFIGKTIGESGIRDHYSCMVIGMEEGKENLTPVEPSRRFETGDILWVVGETEALDALTNACFAKNQQEL